jgi:hypothetical protein
VEVVTGAKGKGVRIRRKQREDVCEGAGDVEEFLNKSDTMYFHTLLRELGSHGYEISSNLDWILEGHAGIIVP